MRAVSPDKLELIADDAAGTIQQPRAHAAGVVVRPDVKAKLLEQGADGGGSTPEKLGQMVKREIAEWREVVKHAKIEAE